jgi:hypothetical protein
MDNLITLAAPQARFPAALQTIATAATVVGAVVSLGCMFWVGQRNRSFVLVALFAVWVLSPYLGLLWARRSVAWSTYAAQAMVCGLIFIVAIGSPVFYGLAAFGRPWSRPAFPFLAAPLAAWFLTGLVLLVVRLSFGGRTVRRS